MGAEAIANRMLSEIEKHPNIAAHWSAANSGSFRNAANVLAVALLGAIVGLLAWGIYETTIDAARDSFIPQQNAGSRGWVSWEGLAWLAGLSHANPILQPLAR